jgi:hypothetical protein
VKLAAKVSAFTASQIELCLPDEYLLQLPTQFGIVQKGDDFPDAGHLLCR